MVFSGSLRAETMPSSATSGSESGGVFLNEIGIGSGYSRGSLKDFTDDYEVIPAFLRIGFNINSLVGLEGHKGTLQFALEPFANPIIGPDEGIETGLDFFFRYLYPLSSTVKLVSEVGAGPMYLSIDTTEQGDSGFNFLDQFGLGLQIGMSEKTALSMGYRFRHISNAGFSQPNTGINSNALIMCFSFLY
jgi:hypothetical protein